jgi:hypothetical protein
MERSLKVNKRIPWWAYLLWLFVGVITGWAILEFSGWGLTNAAWYTAVVPVVLILAVALVKSARNHSVLALIAGLSSFPIALAVRTADSPDGLICRTFGSNDCRQLNGPWSFWITAAVLLVVSALALFITRPSAAKAEKQGAEAAEPAPAVDAQASLFEAQPVETPPVGLETASGEASHTAEALESPAPAPVPVPQAASIFAEPQLVPEPVPEPVPAASAKPVAAPIPAAAPAPVAVPAPVTAPTPVKSAPVFEPPAATPAPVFEPTPAPVAPASIFESAPVVEQPPVARPTVFDDPVQRRFPTLDFSPVEFEPVEFAPVEFQTFAPEPETVTAKPEVPMQPPPSFARPVSEVLPEALPVVEPTPPAPVEPPPAPAEKVAPAAPRPSGRGRRPGEIIRPSSEGEFSAPAAADQPDFSPDPTYASPVTPPPSRRDYPMPTVSTDSGSAMDLVSSIFGPSTPVRDARKTGPTSAEDGATELERELARMRQILANAGHEVTATPAEPPKGADSLAEIEENLAKMRDMLNLGSTDHE